MRLHNAALFPRLELPNELWRAVLLELVSGASFIVMSVEDLSPGVLNELQTIGWLGQQHYTLVVLATSEKDPLQEGITRFYGVAGKASQSRDEIRERLAAFPMIINEEEMPFDDLRRAPEWAALLDRFDFIRLLTPEQRHARLNIQSLNLHLQESLQRGSLDGDLIAQLREGLTTHGTALEPALLLSVHSQLGVAYAQMQEYETAISLLAVARELSRQAGNSVQEGLFLRDVADCYRASGKPSEAIASYLEALPHLMSAKNPDAFIDALRKLAGAYADTQDFKRAAQRFTEALAALDAAGNTHGIMQVQMELGVARYDAREYRAAVHAFQQAVRIARELGASDAEQLCLQMIDKCHKAQNAV
jgi:tetratricopeptide (TPR) repeat protein